LEAAVADVIVNLESVAAPDVALAFNDNNVSFV
jgi:hypothetical protein